MGRVCEVHPEIIRRKKGTKRGRRIGWDEKNKIPIYENKPATPIATIYVTFPDYVPKDKFRAMIDICKSFGMYWDENYGWRKWIKEEEELDCKAVLNEALAIAKKTTEFVETWVADRRSRGVGGLITIKEFEETLNSEQWVYLG